MTGEVRSELELVYAGVDAAIAGHAPRCDASGRCCRFAEYGHTLFLSQVEADHLLATAPAYEAPVTRDGCPFQVGKLCTARSERPLGCRVYYCDPAFEGHGEVILEGAIAQLRALTDRHGLMWNYAPLHVHLNQAGPRAPMNDSGRMSLPVVAES